MSQSSSLATTPRELVSNYFEANLVEECLPMTRKTGVQSQVASYQRLKKWYLMLPCLILSIIRYVSKVKWSNPGKEVASSPTPRCRSYWKGNFRVPLYYGHQLYFNNHWEYNVNNPGNYDVGGDRQILSLHYNKISSSFSKCVEQNLPTCRENQYSKFLLFTRFRKLILGGRNQFHPRNKRFLDFSRLLPHRTITTVFLL